MMRTPSLHSIDGENVNNSTSSQGVYDVFYDFTPPQSTVTSSPFRLHQISGQLRLIYQSNLTFSFFHFKHIRQNFIRRVYMAAWHVFTSNSSSSSSKLYFEPVTHLCSTFRRSAERMVERDPRNLPQFRNIIFHSLQRCYVHTYAYVIRNMSPNDTVYVLIAN